MTEAQKELRAERIAIMVESGSTIERAEELCDRQPEIYGIRAQDLTQEGFF